MYVKVGRLPSKDPIFTRSIKGYGVNMLLKRYTHIPIERGIHYFILLIFFKFFWGFFVVYNCFCCEEIHSFHAHAHGKGNS